MQLFRSRIDEIERRLRISRTRSEFYAEIQTQADRRPERVKWTWYTPNEDHIGHHHEDPDREISRRSFHLNLPYRPFVQYRESREYYAPTGHIIVVS